ncbi:MAG: hypothetical protein KAG66_17590 [Methylococcales bacterium]|nr:hypothetical protein [Methylococcales bacterium]
MSLTSLLTALTFGVMAVTGILAFVRPFSIKITGLHSLMGFVFIVLIAAHIINNIAPLKKYMQGKTLLLCIAVITSLTALFFLQPSPVKAILGLSSNLGPATDRFEMKADGMVYQYSPSPNYKMVLTLKGGVAFDPKNPPHVAIWLENQSSFHIKTLHHSDAPDSKEMLPYWAYKVRGWEAAKRDAESESNAKVDAISSPTQNSSFDPADYILPADPDKPMRYRMLIEINQPNDAHGQCDDQPSLIYSVEIDNLRPKSFQLLTIEGSPKKEKSDEGEKWAVYYVDQGLGSALKLIDSVLLTVERSELE